jgi:hypothetical protein
MMMTSVAALLLRLQLDDSACSVDAAVMVVDNSVRVGLVAV